MEKTIRDSIDNIRDECDELEEKIKPKKAVTRGDPMVELF